MEDFVCPKCRKPHISEAKFCFHCGQDLEDAIIQYKAKHLPIKYKQGIHSKFTKEEIEQIKADQERRGTIWRESSTFLQEEFLDLDEKEKKSKGFIRDMIRTLLYYC